MAKLPGPEQLGERPIPQPGRAIAGYQATTGTEAAPGLAIADAGKEMAHFAAVEQEKLDTTRIEDAWNQYKNAALEVTAGEKGVLRKQGGDAVNGDILNAATKNLSVARKAIAEKLSPDQLRRFDERANATDYQVKHQTIEHLVQQQKVYAGAVQTGRIATAAAQIGAMPMNDDVFKGALAELTGKSLDYLRGEGITDPGAQEAYIAEVRDKLIVRRIDKLLYNMPELAEAKFRGLADTISDDNLRLQYQAKTQTVALGVITARDGDQIIAETRQAVRGAALGKIEGDREAQLKQINLTLAKRPNDPDLLEAKYVLENNITEPPSTSGMPNSRDIAAQLPLALAKVEKYADAKYGPDKGNPDRAGYVAKLTQVVKSKIGDEVAQLSRVQEQAIGQLLNAIDGISPTSMGGKAGGMLTTGGAQQGPMRLTSFQQIMGNEELLRNYMLLDYKGKEAIKVALEKNLKAADNGNDSLHKNLLARIHQEPGSPGKIDFYFQIATPENIMALTTAQRNDLRLELERNEPPGGRSLNQLKNAAGVHVENVFRTNLQTNVNFMEQKLTSPDIYLNWKQKWNEEVGRKIDEIVKADPTNAAARVRSMFQTDSKDSVVTPQYLQTFMGATSTPAQALAAGAAAVRAGAPAAQPVIDMPKTITTKEDAINWAKSQPAGTKYREPGDPPNSFRTVSEEFTPKPKTAVKGTSDVAPVATADVTGAPRPAPPGVVTMDANGKITDPPPAPKPTALVPPPVEDSPMPKRIKPGTVADRTARSGATLEARRWENEARAYQRQQGLMSDIGDAMMVPVRIYQAPGKLADAAGRAIAQMIPTEDARVLAAYRDIGKRGYSELDADVIQRALQLGNPFLSPKEIQNGKEMLKDLGVDEVPAPDKTSDAGGIMRSVADFLVPSASAAGMTKAEAEAAAKSGIFDDADRASRAARGADKPAPASYKPGSDDARTTGKTTKAQDDKFIELWMKQGLSRKSAEAQLKIEKEKIAAKKAGR